MLDIPPFYDEAECYGTTTSLFFVEAGQKDWRELQRLARAICFTCDVREECLEYALDTKQPAGIWGGMTFKERESLLKARKRSRAR